MPDMSDRKDDHIDLALKAQLADNDHRFYYEPLLAAHPNTDIIPSFELCGKTLRAPILVSSMTGGAKEAAHINANLARACGAHGIGMGLGSCRILLEDESQYPDFNVRQTMGSEALLLANMGIAQVEELLNQGATDRLQKMVRRLDADGLIIHVNPMQEWLQPEGDHIAHPPIETIEALLSTCDVPIIVKEVGQGMGIESLRRLMKLPIEAVDFGAHGGTNFALLEMMRKTAQHEYQNLAAVGHNAAEMISMINRLVDEEGDQLACKRVIVSGGVKDFLDGYYYIHKVKLPAIYAQASKFLVHARKTYEELDRYVVDQVKGLALCYAYLRVKERGIV